MGWVMFGWGVSVGVIIGGWAFNKLQKQVVHYHCDSAQFTYTGNQNTVNHCYVKGQADDTRS